MHQKNLVVVKGFYSWLCQFSKIDELNARFLLCRTFPPIDSQMLTNLLLSLCPSLCPSPLRISTSMALLLNKRCASGLLPQLPKLPSGSRLATIASASVYTHGVFQSKRNSPAHLGFSIGILPVVAEARAAIVERHYVAGVSILPFKTPTARVITQQFLIP